LNSASTNKKKEPGKRKGVNGGREAPMDEPVGLCTAQGIGKWKE
jgi:hypothetical protein